eukprot:2417111-Pyramimonas_sp.AAC.1
MSACCHTTASSRSGSECQKRCEPFVLTRIVNRCAPPLHYKENGTGARVRSIDALRLYIAGKRYRRSRAKPWPRNGPE